MVRQVLLLSCLLLNFQFLAVIANRGQLLSRDTNTDNLQGLGWSRKAAEEAEAASKYHCSGHGYVFVDTDDTDEKGNPICECNDCFTGPDCSQTVADCVANVASGDPVFLEPFWIANAEAAATVVPAWYRMSYRINDAANPSAVSPALEKQIRAIHALVGNAVTQGRYIVLGTGSTQLINAAINSLSATNSSNPALVVAAAPSYGGFEEQTELFDSRDNLWKGDANAWTKRTNKLNSTTFIEFVTYPNNPDGILEEAALEGENVRTVNDHAYYWPHFTAITHPADEDIMLFTLSKLTGHAGSRLGWAIIKDYDVYQKIYQYVQSNTLGVSHDTQLRATRLLKAITDGYGKTQKMEDVNKDKKQLLFHYSYPVMRNRWERIERIFNSSNRFSVQHLEPAYCNFFKKVTGPSPAYAWVKCKRKAEGNCTAVLESAKITGRSGQEFGVANRHIRLSLIKRDDNFILLERRLQNLVWYNGT
ncbi:hypothetical protein KI387_008685, partial [Taxus chinensis]